MYEPFHAESPKVQVANEHILIWKFESPNINFSFPSIHLKIPIDITIKHSYYFSKINSQLKTSSKTLQHEHIINLESLGWDNIEKNCLFLFFLWLGSDNQVNHAYSASSIFYFLIFADYFQVSQEKTDELLKVLKKHKFRKIYTKISSFLVFRTFNFVFFKAVMEEEFERKTVENSIKNLIIKAQKQKITFNGKSTDRDDAGVYEIDYIEDERKEVDYKMMEKEDKVEGKNDENKVDDIKFRVIEEKKEHTPNRLANPLGHSHTIPVRNDRKSPEFCSPIIVQGGAHTESSPLEQVLTPPTLKRTKLEKSKSFTHKHDGEYAPNINPFTVDFKKKILAKCNDSKQITEDLGKAELHLHTHISDHYTEPTKGHIIEPSYPSHFPQQDLPLPLSKSKTEQLHKLEKTPSSQNKDKYKSSPILESPVDKVFNTPPHLVESIKHNALDTHNRKSPPICPNPYVINENYLVFVKDKGTNIEKPYESHEKPKFPHGHNCETMAEKLQTKFPGQGGHENPRKSDPGNQVSPGAQFKKKSPFDISIPKTSLGNVKTKDHEIEEDYHLHRNIHDDGKLKTSPKREIDLDLPSFYLKILLDWLDENSWNCYKPPNYDNISTFIRKNKKHLISSNKMILHDLLQQYRSAHQYADKMLV
ncbi:hypothetical protein SteCoe_25175 [Stentor coeruleus]|uniref:Uncharacterized protein n=1 Tax=Stentor coeruleus TaxID=5963 RepID=A0A1R2BFX6_9CILI|nr:hypothetical protein SteCoe_25175 [Stentor coeruleus]